MKLPLIVILGPTASGKTAYAIELAKLINGEIICADSRTVYRDMNIGTAKPTVAEMKGIPHWGLDLVKPNTKFTLYDYQQYAYGKIAEIRARGHVPMLVGGSGLYIDAVIYHYQLNTKIINSPSRDELEVMSLDELRSYSISHSIELPRDIQNKRRLIRAIEQGGINHQSKELDDNTIVIGIKTDRNILRGRIEKRARQMIDSGLINEVKGLVAKYGDQEPFRNNLYGVTKRYINGELTLEQYIDAMVAVDWHLVRKQLTWWRNPRRSGDIVWRTLPELMTQLEQYKAMVANAGTDEVLANLANEYKNVISNR